MDARALILGIDTGGTYTDAVLYDPRTREVVASAKALTTRQKLSTGILGAISALPGELLGGVTRVSLSTTLATNACVEGRSGPARLVIVGGSEKVVAERWQEFGLPRPEEILFLPGEVHLDGAVVGLPDPGELRTMLEGKIRPGSCYAVAGMLSNRNPVCEYTAAKVIRELGAYTVCSRDVAPTELNYLRRASTALLNGKLIPIIGEFLSEMRASLDQMGITAPVFIVRSDSGLMREEYAAEHPVETLLCGPSASVSGVLALTEGLQNAVVADIGGTTTDLSLIENGRVYSSGTGADIGGYRLSIGSVCLETIGLGGDTRLYLDSHGALCLDRRRAVPICVLASRYGKPVHDALDALMDSPYQGITRVYEFLELLRMPGEDEIGGDEKRICEILKDGPRSLAELAEATGRDLYTLRVAHLEEIGAVIRSGFTLTDAMHLTGKFTAFDASASRKIAWYFTRILDISPETLCKRAFAMAEYRLYRAAARLCLKRQDPDLVLDEGSEALTELAFSRSGRLIAPSFRMNADLVGVGAPAGVFLSGAAEPLGARPVLPRHSAVANAVGAAASVVSAEYTVNVRAEESAGGSGFTVVGGEEICVFEEMDEAIGEAKRQAEACARALARSRGLLGELRVTVTADRRTSVASTSDGDVTVNLGAVVTAVAESDEA